MQRVYLEHPELGPSAVEVGLSHASVWSLFGRPGALVGHRSQDYEHDNEAIAAFEHQVTRLTRRGYVPGRSNPALVDVIREQRDEASYRVYADWLSNVGDPRGDLIQLQLAREVTPEAPPSEHEVALMIEFGAQLAEPYWRKEFECRWHRGFVDEITFTSRFRGEYAWPSRWCTGVELQPQTLGWYTLRNVLQHPSGALLRWVTERSMDGEVPRVERYRVRWAPSPLRVWLEP